MNNPREPSYGDQLVNYRSFSTRAGWVAGGVVALLALASSDLGTYLFHKGAPWLAATVVTLSVTAGALAAVARVQFQWKATALEHRIDEQEVDNAAEAHDEPWPHGTNHIFTAGFLCLLAAGCAFIVLLWVTAV